MEKAIDPPQIRKQKKTRGKFLDIVLADEDLRVDSTSICNVRRNRGMGFYQTKKLGNNKTNQNSEETAYKTEYMLTVYPILSYYPNKNPTYKQDKGPKQICLKRYSNDQQVYENILNTSNHQQNTKIRETLYHTGHNDSSEVGEQLLSRRWGRENPCFIVSENVN